MLNFRLNCDKMPLDSSGGGTLEQLNLKKMQKKNRPWWHKSGYFRRSPEKTSFKVRYYINTKIVFCQVLFTLLYTVFLKI